MNKRIVKLLRKCKSLDAEAVLLSALPSIRYFTGFTGSNGACLITPSEKYFITDSRYEEQARIEIEGFNILIKSDPPVQHIIDQKLIPRKTKIAFENERISYLDYIRLTSYYYKKNILPLNDTISKMQSIKDNDELQCLERAADITDEVFDYICSIIKPGLKEIEISAEISYQIKKRGGEKDSFDPIVAGGPNAALPHAHAGDRELKSGEMVILDFGAIYNGYHADITRTLMLGKPGRRQREIYTAVFESQKAALEKARAGISAARLDSTARNVINRRGFGEFFGHGLGHGLGLEIHEAPRISQANKSTLKAGNVVTIEPGIYIPGLGGVRIEDDIVIEKDGCRILTKSSKELKVL